MLRISRGNLLANVAALAISMLLVIMMNHRPFPVPMEQERQAG
jgi:hypothetical protein